MTITPFAVGNAVGLVTFGTAGGLDGIGANLDPFDVVVLGLLTALGGDSLSDSSSRRTRSCFASTST